MNERELGKALLHGERPIDLEALTQSVLRRDRRRVGVLSAICFVAWMMVVMLPWATVLPAMAKIGQITSAMNGGPATDVNGVRVGPDQRAASLLAAEVMKEGTITTFLCSVGSMFVAAVCTVLLVVVSRRATLRQVNARLAEISAQLKRLAGDAKG